MDHRVEIRIEVFAEETRVLDGVCQATGRSRTDVMREIIREWSDRQLHIATVVCRVAGRHPGAPD